MSMVDEAVAALEAGQLVLLPTDTVYGLACGAENEDAVRQLSRLKRRDPSQPVALVAASVDALVALVPELAGRAVPPGPFTIVLPNPARRLPWLTGERAETIGVRVPRLDGDAREVVEAVGTVAATSANLHGRRDPRSLDDVPAEIRAAVAAEIDGGELPGIASTVLDLTGPEPRVLREGAVPADEALALVAVVTGQ